MRWLRGMNHRNESDALNEFWDEVVQRSPATPLTRDPVPIELGAIVRQLHAEQDARQQRPIYADRQLAALLSYHREAQSMNTYPLRNSDVRSAPSASTADRLFGHGRRRGWIPALTAGAAIAILLAVMLALAIFANLFRDGGNHPVFVAPSTPTPLASPSPTARLVWTYTGVGDMRLSDPPSATIAPDGSIWVVDGGKGRIQILNPDGTVKETWGEQGGGTGFLLFGAGVSAAGEVAFASDGSFYVGECTAKRVQLFDKARQYLSSWSGTPTPDQSFGFLIGVSVDPVGDVWVTDDSSNTVSKFTAEGKYLLTIGGSGTKPGEFVDVGTVAFDREGRLLVPDGRGDIQMFSLDGTFVSQIPVADSAGQSIHAGYDVSTDPSGRLYVTDPESSAVYIYDPGGRLLLTWTGGGSKALEDPWNVIADADGNMYVVDHSAGAVYKVHIDFH